MSLESVESLPTGSETTPSLINLPETPAIGVTVAAPSSVVEGVSVVDTSAGSEGVTVAAPSSDVEGVSVVGTSAGSEGVTVAGPSSRVAKGTGSSVPGSGVEEGTTADSSPKTSQDILGKFAEDWLETLDKDETKSVSLFLCYQLVHVFSFTATKATEYAAAMVKKSDRTVRRWRSGLIDNDGVLPESQQGRYQRSGVLWHNEELNKKAAEYVRENAAVKGRPILTTVDFCKWVNECLLPNCTLEHAKLVLRQLVFGCIILGLRF